MSGRKTVAGFTGMLIVKPKANPFGARYEILVDKFKTRTLIVEKTESGLESCKKIQSRRGAWFVDARERNDLHECTDIDIQASPVTNTIPIKRTRLKVGQKIWISRLERNILQWSVCSLACASTTQN